jgi:curved DNA-binding protein CbpA
MVFRLNLNSCGSSSSSSSERREVLKRFRAFALTVHPDKVPKRLQDVGGVRELFTEGFKALLQAKELLMGCCK